ncbi:DEKNAAC103384 [Brettanomyces naardenensis]|uniref:Conserved oligomeric Golgi complex subunit 2 n=1 Tax=Brettanomyces naardenensis TaxID=13370 RepID=A0A448YN54_BRENA|nr:DEKNAAC103384 [Brettanomyces naardenensis]
MEAQSLIRSPASSTNSSLSLELPESNSAEFAFYSEELTRESLQDDMEQLDMNTAEQLDPSLLLLKNFKYWPLDDLSDNLQKLLREVDSDLVDLVNDNYLKFIALGKSIYGSLDITHDVKIDVSNYVRLLHGENDNIKSDLRATSRLVEFKRRLSIYRRIVSVVILLDEQVDTFTRLCDGANSEMNEEELKHLIALYFSINKQYGQLMKMVMSREEVGDKEMMKNSELMTGLSKRMSALQMEFKSLLESHLEVIRNRQGDHENNLKVFELLKLYQIVEGDNYEYSAIN